MMSIILLVAFLPVFGLVLIVTLDLIKSFQEPIKPPIPTAYMYTTKTPPLVARSLAER